MEDIKEEIKEEIKKNNHSIQLLTSKYLNIFPYKNYEFTRTLPDDFTRLEYHKKNNEIKSVLHWGQRKLLLSEIEFLTLMINKYKLEKSKIIVIYIGAAPATHTQFLANLFPQCKFHLYDPLPFNCKSSKQIKIFEQYFTKKDIQKYQKNKKYLLISDIRNPIFNYEDPIESKDKVIGDMELQKSWVEKIKPLGSMLKFRLPWDNENTKYLKGDIYLPVWGPVSTTECRLIIEIADKSRKIKYKIYNNKKYEEQLFYFNNVYRPSLFKHKVIGEGICHCYDCTSEIHILKQYLELFIKITKNKIEIINEKLLRLLYNIFREISNL